MTTRDLLHRFVDVLPDADADAVAPLLEALARHALAPAARVVSLDALRAAWAAGTDER